VLYPGIREEFNLDFSIKHFNHGAFGAIPNTVRESQRELFAEIDANPTGFYRRKLEPRLEEARLVAARYLGAAGWVCVGAECIGRFNGCHQRCASR
jgi:isopenicillin-N epimerase